MKGFVNAPHITEFAVGMRVYLHAEVTATVIQVLPEGNARVVRLPETGETFLSMVVEAELIPEIKLDLTSLWVGREFVEKDSRERAVVTASPEFTHMGFVHVERAGGITEWIVENFWVMFEPVEKGE